MNKLVLPGIHPNQRAGAGHSSKSWSRPRASIQIKEQVPGNHPNQGASPVHPSKSWSRPRASIQIKEQASGNHTNQLSGPGIRAPLSSKVPVYIQSQDNV